MAVDDAKASDDTTYPSYCTVQDDWELSLIDEGTFWMTLNKSHKDESKRTYIESTVKISINHQKNKSFISNLTLNKPNDEYSKWKINILPFPNDLKAHYAEITFAAHNFDKYKLIPSYHQIPTTTDILTRKPVVNCIDIAKSSYFKRLYICAGLKNGKIQVYDVETSKLKMICSSGNDEAAHITKCKFFPFGDLILSGDTKGVLNIYAIADPKGQAAVSFMGHHKGDISCVDFIGEGSEFLSGASDNTVILWNASTQKPLITFGQLGLSTINQVKVVKDKMVMSASNNGYFKGFDLKSGKEIFCMNGCNGESVECFEVFDNDNIVILGADDGVCYLYDVRKMDANDMKCVGKIQRDGQCLKKIIKRKNDGLILCNSNGNIWQWQIESNKEIKVENVKLMSEWTGNEQFGISDVAITDECDKMYVATKKGEVKEYLML